MLMYIDSVRPDGSVYSRTSFLFLFAKEIAASKRVEPVDRDTLNRTAVSKKAKHKNIVVEFWRRFFFIHWIAELNGFYIWREKK